MERIESLVIGEVSSAVTSEITDAILELGIDLSADMTTEMNFTVFDPDLRMMRNNYFQVRRPLSYAGYDLEIAQIQIDRTAGSFDTIQVTCRSAAVQRMRRETGTHSWGTISPSMFAKQMADAHGLKMFIKDSGARVGITRQQGDNIDESTWDVLQRLAADLNYIVFESYGVLYFTDEEFLVERQPGIIIDLLAVETDPWFPYSLSLSQNDDDWAGSSFTAQVGRENGRALRPGMTVEVLNCGPFSDERKHLITSVTWAAGDPSPVAIQGRTLRETEDTVADTSTGVTSWGKRVLREGVGSIDNPQADVMRLQGIVGVEKTGVFGPTTTAAVKRWQFINSLGIETIALPPAIGTTIITDGIIDADDWAIILGVPMSPRETLSSNHAQPPGITTTAGALQIDDIDDADKKWYR